MFSNKYISYLWDVELESLRRRYGVLYRGVIMDNIVIENCGYGMVVENYPLPVYIAKAVFRRCNHVLAVRRGFVLADRIEVEW